ncbi:NAD-dependent protein deacylase, partial [Staphylococcus epidermidis]
MNNKIESLKNILNHSSNIVFFTGAGVSVASGVPDFRSMG